MQFRRHRPKEAGATHRPKEAGATPGLSGQANSSLWLLQNDAKCTETNNRYGEVLPRGSSGLAY